MRATLATIVVCAVITAWALPPDEIPLVRNPERTVQASPERQALNDLEAEIRLLDRQRQHLIWLERMEAIMGERQTGTSVFVTGPASSSAVAAFERRVADRSPESPVMSTGYHVPLRDQDLKVRGIRGFTPGAEYHLGTTDQGPYCLKIRTLTGSGDPDTRLARHNGSLGLCAFYGQFGMPSSTIESWLLAGGGLFAEEEAEQRESTPGLRGLFGFRSTGASSRPTHIESCAAGREYACAALFVEPLDDSDIQRSRTLLGHFSNRSMFRLSFRAPLLFRLRDEFGADRFQAFWQSPEPVDVAFANAFGRSAGSWTMEQVRARHGAVLPGPRIASLDLAGTLLFLLLATGWALFAARRRAGPERDGLHVP